MPDRRTSEDGRLVRSGRGGHRGSALVETAIVVPLLLLLAFGVVAVGRVAQAQSAVSAVAREAARAAALASDAAEATGRGLTRAEDIAAAYGLTNGSLAVSIDPGSFARGSSVRATVRYEVTLDDLPLLGWTRFEVTSGHVERTDRYRSRWPG